MISSVTPEKQDEKTKNKKKRVGNVTQVPACVRSRTEMMSFIQFDLHVLLPLPGGERGDAMG